MPRIEDQLWGHNKKGLTLLKEVLSVRDSVVLVQPTGSGKSWVMFGYIESIFRPDLKVIIAQSVTSIEVNHKSGKAWNPEWEKNVRYTTYQMLCNLRYASREELELHDLTDIDLIILDEVHHIAAPMWNAGFEKLKEHSQNAKILGLTATPVRYLDGSLNVADEFFDGEVIETLTLVEAIKTGVFKKPLHITAFTNLGSLVKDINSEIAKSTATQLKKKSAFDLVNKLNSEWEKQLSLADIVEKHIEEHLPEESNLKFIVFMPTIAELLKNKTMVEEWFTSKGIRSNVNTYELYTGSDEKDATVLGAFEEAKEDSVDLLFVINKLNEGVHINTVSGLIMLRNTMSPTVFYQQLGRAFHTGMDKSPLIFDFVQNYDTVKSVKNTLIEGGATPKKVVKKKRNKSGKELDFSALDYGTLQLFSEMRGIENIIEEIRHRIDIHLSQWESSTDSDWLSCLLDTVDFITTNGRLPTIEDDFGMATWFVTLQAQVQQGTLQDWKMEKVESLFPE